MVSIAIVDDEKEEVEKLSEMIRRYFAENGGGGYSISAFYDGINFVKNYSQAYDIIFLDIDMKHLNGLKTAKVIRRTDDRTAIIFVTKMARYAINGYEVNALDFIVKPVDYFSFSLKMKKAINYASLNRDKKIFLRNGDVDVVLNASDICYIEVLNHYLIYHTTKGDFKIWGALHEIAEKLGETGFALCNRCYLVNLSYVTGVVKNVVTVGEHELTVSRYKRKEFLEKLAAFLGER